MREYYKAYEERYKTAHQNGVSWSSDQPTPIVTEILLKYNITTTHRLLEVGCGEGRDARVLLNRGFDLMATDISREAIEYCKKTIPAFCDHFRVLDCLSETPGCTFDFIYGIAVIHMLVLNEDRNRFYRFLHDHLAPNGLALICTMGDGETELQSDITRAFELQTRDHESGPMLVAGTSCRMVSFHTFERELAENELEIVEQGTTASLPDFNCLMYAVVKKK